DTLVMKACLVAIDRFFEETGTRLPVMISGTIFENHRTLSAQPVEAFYISVAHFDALSVGLNCAVGVDLMRPEIETLAGMIGERTNITGSKRFARLIKEGNFEAAVTVARDQVEGGANILDVNMDADLIDSEEAMTHFLNLVSADPAVYRLPIMVDSSRWSVIEAG